MPFSTGAEMEIRQHSGKPRLLDEVRNAIIRRHYSRDTEKAYVYWVRFFIRYHNMRHPRDLDEKMFPSFLAF